MKYETVLTQPRYHGLGSRSAYAERGARVPPRRRGRRAAACNVRTVTTTVVLRAQYAQANVTSVLVIVLHGSGTGNVGSELLGVASFYLY